MSKKALIPTTQEEVSFYEDKIIAVQLADGAVYVPVRPICELLGVQWSAQRKRILRDVVLAEGLTSVSVMDTKGLVPQRRDMLCLPLQFISGFLFGISAKRVREELQEQVIRYQRECHDVLARAFQEGQLTQYEPLQALLQQDTPEVQAYRMIKAMEQMALQQIMMRARVDDHEYRLEALEAQLSQPDRFVSESQAMQISQAVKAIALALSKRSGKNEFGGIYGELYRHFEITSYKSLPASRFEEALQFLNDWLQALISAVPF